jgi:RNA polymerase-binding transcription factor DksA
MPFTDACQRCGLGIPRARLDDCPICQRAVVQNKTAEDAEDPIKILKLRLAKGEISKEEYEDLKKSVES